MVRAQLDRLAVSEAKKRRTKYRTNRTKNWKAYNAALKARGALTLWLAEPSGKRGRQRTFSDAAIQFCLSIKGLFRLALRQTQTLGLFDTGPTGRHKLSMAAVLAKKS